MPLRRTLATTLAVALLFTGTALVGTASAVHVGCGSVITQNTVLDSDVGPCGVGLVIAADNVTLDLNGHSVTGLVGTRGDGPGIWFTKDPFVTGVTGSRVINGTVNGWDSGIYVEYGGGNTVANVNVVDNIGRGIFDEGIQVYVSNNNFIRNNFVARNGTGAGIVSYDSTGNAISNNVVRDNSVQRTSPPFPASQNGVNTVIGIWIVGNCCEGPSSNNVVNNNIVQRNGLDGIQTQLSTGDVIRNNYVSGNGAPPVVQRPTTRDGTGIFIGGLVTGTLVRDNIVTGNGGNGIGAQAISTTGNQILANRTSGNNAGPNPQANFDLFDIHADCDANVWRANTYVTFSPPCVTTP